MTVFRPKRVPQKGLLSCEVNEIVSWQDAGAYICKQIDQSSGSIVAKNLFTMTGKILKIVCVSE
jgi:hypothetical protein